MLRSSANSGKVPWMCGIAGLVRFDGGVEEEMLRKMGGRIAHRGPDESGVWIGRACGLAHRRLRVIDLSARAAQPMSNEDGRLRLVFNGEIYNFPELRRDLVTAGHAFRSDTDSEVILHGYEEWGAGVFSKLRGMFALALWDEKEQSLVLGRDRLGKKPLFYAQGGGWLAFGSELSVFRETPFLKIAVRRESLREYVQYGYVNSPYTILDGVWRLPPGSWAIWNQRGFTIQAYWRLPERAGLARAEGATVAEAADALEPALLDAVQIRLASDVPLGCFLSGGVDSSLVSALAQESMGRRLSTFSVGFAGWEGSEARHAAKVARHLGTDHHELTVAPSDALEGFEEIHSRLSEPLGDDSFLPTFLISRETKRQVTVVLTGDGGDELFCGYSKYRHFVLANRTPSWLRGVAARIRSLPLGDRARKGGEALATPNSLELARWLSSLWKAEELDGIFATPFPNASGRDAFRERWEAWANYPDLERWMLCDMETYLEGDILPKLDRASMSVALETRSPFLDHRVIEEAFRWAPHARVRGGGKEILKEILARRLPPELFRRPKQGFGMPLAEWYRGPLRGLLTRYMDRERLRRRGVFEPNRIQKMVELHLSGRRNFARKLHALVAFEIWADRLFGERQELPVG